MFRSAFWDGRLAKELTNLVPYNNESSFSAILAVLCDNDMEFNIHAGIKTEKSALHKITQNHCNHLYNPHRHTIFVAERRNYYGNDFKSRIFERTQLCR